MRKGMPRRMHARSCKKHGNKRGRIHLRRARVIFLVPQNKRSSHEMEIYKIADHQFSFKGSCDGCRVEFSFLVHIHLSQDRTRACSKSMSGIFLIFGGELCPLTIALYVVRWTDVPNLSLELHFRALNPLHEHFDSVLDSVTSTLSCVLIRCSAL
jgi:hypothetical protein